jgi:hypothetical protein
VISDNGAGLMKVKNARYLANERKYDEHRTSRNEDPSANSLQQKGQCTITHSGC